MKEYNDIEELYELRKKVTRCPIPKDLKTSRKFMSSVIRNYNNGKITEAEARTLSYLVDKFINTCKTIEIEERLTSLEQLNDNNRN